MLAIWTIIKKLPFFSAMCLKMQCLMCNSFELTWHCEQDFRQSFYSCGMPQTQSTCIAFFLFEAASRISSSKTFHNSTQIFYAGGDRTGRWTCWTDLNQYILLILTTLSVLKYQLGYIFSSVSASFAKISWNSLSHPASSMFVYYIQLCGLFVILSRVMNSLQKKKSDERRL